MTRRILGSLFLSTLLHAGLFACALGVIAWDAAHQGPVSIDLTASMLPRVSASRAALPPPAPPWILATGRRLAPLPRPAPRPVSATPEPEVAVADVPPPPCPAPCADRAGDWVPAGDLGRLPVWTDGLITEADYPPDMRREQKNGLVVVDVLIDTHGVVRGVSLVQGSDPEFNVLVLKRLAQSRFQPALGKDGLVVPCRARLPIEFQLH